MHLKNPLSILTVLLLLSPSLPKVRSQQVDGAQFNSPNGGPPGEYFTAAPTMPIAALQTSATELKSIARRGTYPVRSEGQRVSIYKDWDRFENGAAIVWTADMDVDCDGVDFECKGNMDGQGQTNWGSLSSYEVPWVVIPQRYLQGNKKALPGNNVAAVICNGNMFYGILGDSDGDTPNVIGEASWLMARTCFPDEGLAGDVGHSPVDVTCPSSVLPSSAISETYLTDFGILRSMGDQLVNALAGNVVGDSSGDGGAPPANVHRAPEGNAATSTYTSTNSQGGSVRKMLIGAALFLEVWGLALGVGG